MSVPVDPTASGIVSEGMRRALGRAPTSGEVARGIDQWIPEIHNDIWMQSNSHRLVETTAMQLLTEGTQRYTLPSDCEAVMAMTVLDGSDRETAQSGSGTTITLAASDTSASAARIGREIVTLSGTGSSQRRTITGWTAPAATVAALSVSLTASTTYVVVDHYQALTLQTVAQFNQSTDRTDRERPEEYYVFATEYWVKPVPDKTYPILIQYWVNLQQVDAATSIYTSMLRNWRNLHVQGIYLRTLQDEDDARYVQEYPLYTQMLSRITGKSVQIGAITPQEF